MQPTVQFHRVAKIEFGMFTHFPEEEGRGEFWSRSLILTAEDGKKFFVPLFSHSEAAMTVHVQPQPARDDGTRPPVRTVRQESPTDPTDSAELCVEVPV